MHVAASAHALPQSPQFLLSLVTSVQTPLQIFFGARHAPPSPASPASLVESKDESIGCVPESEATEESWLPPPVSSDAVAHASTASAQTASARARGRTERTSRERGGM